MAECAYYLKALFPSEEKAKRASEKLNVFFAEAREAHEFYQHGFDSGEEKKFWKTFKSRFPLVFDYVKTLPDYMDGERHISGVLTGKLDFGQDEDIRLEGNVICWIGSDVWHNATWSPLCNYIESKYGAIKVIYDNEENGCMSLDSLQLYDYEDIVNNLMEHEELFPMLLGIHDDLNEILDLKMRKH